MVKETFREVGKKASELCARLRDLEQAHPHFDLRRRIIDDAEALADKASDRANGKWPVSNREASRAVNGMIDRLSEDLSRAPQSVRNDETVKVLLRDLLNRQRRET